MKDGVCENALDQRRQAEELKRLTDQIIDGIDAMAKILGVSHLEIIQKLIKTYPHSLAIPGQRR
jgi:hypothetical protein